jgi:phosphoribosylglycinamide formyltransferase-1
MRKLVVLASGSGSLLQALIDAPDHGITYQISAVISDNPTAVALTRAQSAGITAIALPTGGLSADLWQQELKTVVLNFAPDLVVSAGFMRIIKSDLFKLIPIINAHPSLLPNFPGGHAVADALAAGVSQTGATVHFVDAGVDTGEIIAQQVVQILPDDTESSLHERIKVVERDQLVSVVVKLCQQEDLWAGLSDD